MFDDKKMKLFESGDLFLGLNQANEEIGISTKKHAVTTAAARSGKGACVIIPNLMRWPHNALVIDPKGENAQQTWQERQAMGSKVYVLDPFETPEIPEHLRAAFNPLANIEPDSLTAGADLEVIADGLVKRSDPKHAQWDDGAASLLAGIMAYVVEKAPEEERTLMAVRDVLLQSREELYEDAQRMKLCELCDGMAQDAGSTIMTAIDAEKSMEADFLSNAKRHIKWLGQTAMKNVLGKSTFNLNELKNGKATVYVVLPPQRLETHAAFMRLFVRCALDVMAAGGSGRGEKCLFILDEFYSLGKMDSISKSAGLMPSYGVQLWVILQDIGQLNGMYGKDIAATFFGNSDLHQFFGNTDRETLELMSKLTGIVGIDEISAAPDAPMQSSGQSLLGAMASQSRDSTTRGLGAFVGALSSNASQLGNAWESAEHQNKMNEYQREMASLGKPRATAEQMAQLVQCKNDVVADNMFCIAHGSDKFLVRPAPYFRKTEHIKAPSKSKIREIRIYQNGSSRTKKIILNIIGAMFLFSAVVMSNSIEQQTNPKDHVAYTIFSVLMGLVGVFLVWRAYKKK